MLLQRSLNSLAEDFAPSLPKATANEAYIYLDYQATTPLDQRVLMAMGPFLGEHFGNPHSVLNRRGKLARQAVELARDKIAASLGVDSDTIIFVSGATEANNLAILGAARAGRYKGRHIAVSAIEHKSVLESARALVAEGFEISLIPVTPSGLVEVSGLQQTLRADTILVSVMAVNNEIGTIQPTQAIGEVCKSRGIAFHCDATQAVGNIPFDLSTLPVDFASISSHKIYGPMGIGALYIRNLRANCLVPLLYGGGQEQGLRPGTLPTPLCVGFGCAAEIAVNELSKEAARLAGLRTRLLAQLTTEKGFFLNGDATRRISSNLHIGFLGVPSESLIRLLPELEFSTNSACNSTAGGMSHVLDAIGCQKDRARYSIRLGLGRQTSIDDIDFASRGLLAAVAEIRSTQPCPWVEQSSAS
jgi:cysteine desulfurase